jgi:hypothetical protein
MEILIYKLVKYIFVVVVVDSCFLLIIDFLKLNFLVI